MNRILVTLSLATLVFGCKKSASNPELPVADAGASQTIQSPLSTVTVSGKGKTNHVAIRSYLWSYISGPSNSVITHPADTTTTITGLTLGSYIFQFSVVDNNGLTGTDTMTVNVVSPTQNTISAQPSNNNNELNFAGNSSINRTAHDVDLDAGVWTIGGDPFTLRGAFKFDLTNIPASATIVSAHLSLYSNPTPINGNLMDANYGSDNSFFIRRVTGNWSSSSTWLTQPQVETTNQIAIAHTDQSSLDLVNIDVTALVQQMVSQGNYGFKLQLQNENVYNIRQFCSSTHVDASKHPKLVVVYQ